MFECLGIDLRPVGFGSTDVKGQYGCQEKGKTHGCYGSRPLRHRRSGAPLHLASYWMEVPQTEWGWLVTPEELQQWTILNDERFLIVNKPGLVVCHPSKHGPWSSLIGACREWLGVERLHMPSRLDRETSGVMVLVKDAVLASKMQRAAESRHVSKQYIAILTGALHNTVIVDQPIGRADESEIAAKRKVVSSGQESQTVFEPVSTNGHYTLARVSPRTGRLHQIRVHAGWLGHPIAGDKLYGPDESLFLEFIRHGFTSRLEASLPLPRHALHASNIEFTTSVGVFRFDSPLTDDLVTFCREHGLLALDGSLGATARAALPI